MVAESLQVAIPMQTSYKKGVLEAYVGRKHVLFGAAGNGWRQGLCSATAAFR